MTFKITAMIVPMAFIVLTAAVSNAQGSSRRTPPNIILVLADDLGIGDVNCYGQERCLIETPNLDRIASEGMRFTHAYSNASVCVPSRRAIMTGRYDWRFAAPTNNGPWGFCGPKPNTEKSTLATILKRGGYRTSYVGKWHLGTIMTTRDGKTQGPNNVDYTRPLQFGPSQFGFDTSFILPGSLDMYPYAFARDHVWQGSITAQKGWSAFNRVGPAEQSFEDHRVLETFYREAESFIREQSGDTPFFLYLALTAPHTPTSPGARWKGKSELGVYGDFVMEVDHSVGRIIDALEEKHLADDTLIIFSSDHGPASYAGNILKATAGQIKQLEEKGHFSNGPHRGYKFSIYEGGLRVPLIARWPRVIGGPTTCGALVGLNDLFATFAELAGVPLGASEAPDSISFAKSLQSPSAKASRESLVMQSVTAFAIREGDWKLCLCPGSGTQSRSFVTAGNDPSPEAAWKSALERLARPPTESDLWQPPFVQLYHVANDPHEDVDVAAKHPERVARLAALLKDQIRRGRSTAGPDLSNDKTVNVVNLRDRRLPEVVRESVRNGRPR